MYRLTERSRLPLPLLPPLARLGCWRFSGLPPRRLFLEAPLNRRGDRTAA